MLDHERVKYHDRRRVDQPERQFLINVSRHAVWLTMTVIVLALVSSASRPGRADTAAPANTSASPAVQSARGLAALLIDKAKFWSGHGRADDAASSVQRALQLDPTYVPALVMAAHMALDSGDAKSAEAYLTTLKRVAPNDPELALLTDQQAMEPARARLLAEARTLAQQGHGPQAIAKYKALFGNKTPPDSLALEYYPLVVGASPQGSVEADQALDAMEQIANAHPESLAIQHAYAHALTFDEERRGDGVDVLAKLAQNPAMTREVTPEWRQALIWSGASIRSRDQLDIYLQTHPSDPELDQLEARMQSELPTRSLFKQMQANQALNEGNIADAAQLYSDSYSLDHANLDALVMVAALRLQQGRVAESDQLLAKAIAAAPERRNEFLAMLGRDPASQKKAAEAGARIASEAFAKIDTLARAGKFAEAEAQLRHLMGDHPDAGSLMQLADLQRRGGHPDLALATLRRAVETAPENGAANMTLGSALIGADQLEQARPYLDKAAAIFQRGGEAASQRALMGAQAEWHRKSAARLTDPAARLAELRQAMQSDPQNPWLRLDVARTLQPTDPEQAREVMAPVVQAANDPASATNGQALEATFIWARLLGDDASAEALAAMVPQAQRSPAMAEAIQQALIRKQLASAQKRTNPALAMLRLAARPDPTGVRGSMIGPALARLQGGVGLQQALEGGLAATPPPATATRLRYAYLLLGAGQTEAAKSMVAPLADASLSEAQRRDLAQLSDQITQTDARLALERHDPNRAAALLAPLVARGDGDATLQLLQTQVDLARGKPADMLDRVVALSRQNPADMQRRNIAINTALAAGRTEIAATLAAEGLQLDPANVGLLMQAAQVERQRGHEAAAMQLLLRARDARSKAIAAGAG